MREDVMSPGARKGTARYKLFGGRHSPSPVRDTQALTWLIVISHHGPNASGGHYTLDVLHPNRDDIPPGAGAAHRPREAWVRLDDELVSDISPADVLGRGRAEGEGGCAYLLFYRRVGTGRAGAGAGAWAT